MVEIEYDDTPGTPGEFGPYYDPAWKYTKKQVVWAVIWTVLVMYALHEWNVSNACKANAHDFSVEYSDANNFSTVFGDVYDGCMGRAPVI